MVDSDDSRVGRGDKKISDDGNDDEKKGKESSGTDGNEDGR